MPPHRNPIPTLTLPLKGREVSEIPKDQPINRMMASIIVNQTQSFIAPLRLSLFQKGDKTLLGICGLQQFI